MVLLFLKFVSLYMMDQVSSEASEEAAEGGPRDGAEELAGGDGSGGAKESEQGLAYRHRLSNVNFINMGRLQRIKCVVDNQVCVLCVCVRYGSGGSAAVAVLLFYFVLGCFDGFFAFLLLLLLL